MDGAWTIGDLAERAAAVLAGEPVRVSGRVRELPNERLIRWYTTIGLLDPPLARRGRTALYGPRHLLQLVAVKRRQAAGLAIAEIQAELAGATDDALRDIAGLPEPLPAGETTVRKPRSRDRFWAEAPTATAGPASRRQGYPIRATAAHAEAGQAEAVHAEAVHAEAVHAEAVHAEFLDADADADPAGERARAPRAGADGMTSPAVVPGLRLAPGVTLLLDGGPRPVTAADLAAIGAAARPLLDELRRRGLHPANPGSAAEPTDPAPPTSPGRHSS